MGFFALLKCTCFSPFITWIDILKKNLRHLHCCARLKAASYFWLFYFGHQFPPFVYECKHWCLVGKRDCTNMFIYMSVVRLIIPLLNFVLVFKAPWLLDEKQKKDFHKCKFCGWMDWWVYTSNSIRLHLTLKKMDSFPLAEIQFYSINVHVMLNHS